MNQLRHLAIRTEEPEKLAAFYIEAFGFREVREGWPPAQGQERRSFHLTDGYFELAILANAPNQSPNGLYHFGIKVDDMDETVRRLKSFQKHVQRTTGRYLLCGIAGVGYRWKSDGSFCSRVPRLQAPEIGQGRKMRMWRFSAGFHCFLRRIPVLRFFSF